MTDDVPFGPIRREIETCVSCGITHRKVEARGVYHCPNPLCTVTGAAWFRMRLPSYKETGGQHSVDLAEWIVAGVRFIDANDDEEVRAILLPSIHRVVDRMVHHRVQTN